MMNLALAYLCYLPEPAYALAGLVDFNEITNLTTTKKRLFGLTNKTQELAGDYSLVKANINSVLSSWWALPKADRECIATFIPVLKKLILSNEFASTINATGTASSQDDLMLVGLSFYGVMMDHNCTNPF
uniref:Uncharacterized protein n=1 Tax=Panagrolaimus davidi TaxID=227884 RepID=A0A914P8K4_9BILA